MAVNSKNRIPSSEMLFITGDDNKIYKADTTAYDSVDATIISHYRSAPLWTTSDQYTVNKFGLWRESDDDTTGLNIRFYNAEGDSVDYTYVDTIATRYDIHNVHMDKSNYFQIDIIDSLVDSLAIEQIDVWPVYRGSREKQ